MKWLIVIVFCFVVCVVKCSGILKSELEDFADYLEKTSKLDVILRKGNPEHAYDEDNIISDYAWEDSGKFEGDLILNDRQRKFLVEDVAEGIARNGVQDSTKKWPDNEVIYYIQKEHFKSDQVQAIMSGMEDIAQVSCIKFKPYDKGDRAVVVIQGSRNGCFSQVGFQGMYQVVNLSHRHPVGSGCFRHGTVVHELLHTLGFYHMQSSPDRDDYVTVLWKNIIDTARHNFRKYNSFSVWDYGVGYDYESVLHYSRRAFSVNRKDTLVPKQSGASIGQRTGMSDKDIKKLNKMYCDGASDGTSANDENKKLKATKKKTPKSKPFQGHGIGYHKGNTVAIKLNPDAKTYKITRTIPRYHVFDHFSTTPQALSPTTFFEGIGTAKEINYNDTTPNYNIELLSYDNNSSIGVEPKIYINNNLDKALNTPMPKDDVTTNDKKILTESDESIEEDNAIKVGDTINEAIDRLGKILKTHVYPSQTPDLDAYKIKPYYSEIFAPATKHEPDTKIAEVDEAFRTKESFFKTVALEPSIGIESLSSDEELSEKTEKENNTEIQDENLSNYFKDTSYSPDYNEDTYHKEHASSSQNRKDEQEQLPKEEYTIYKYGYPRFLNFFKYKPQSYFNNKEYLKQIDPPYKSSSQFDNIYNESDEKDLENVYAGLREVKDKTTDKQKETLEEPTSSEIEFSYGTSYPLHTLNKVKEEIIEPSHYDTLKTLERPQNKDANFAKNKDELLEFAVPLQNKRYTEEENEDANNKYNRTYRLSAPNEEKDNFSQKLQLVANIKTILGELPGDKEAYHLFGVLVPVTEKKASSIQNNKSSKDNT